MFDRNVFTLYFHAAIFCTGIVSIDRNTDKYRTREKFQTYILTNIQYEI